MYMKLYSQTLEPIEGPQFRELASEPRLLPPQVKTPAERPKKKRSTKNDIHADPTKLGKVGTIINCTYCKAQGHNDRTCETKKNDIIRKAIEEGTVPIIKKYTVVCKSVSKKVTTPEHVL